MFTKIAFLSICVFSSLTFAAEPAVAPADDLGLEGATLEDLLGVKTTVATKKAVTTRQTPGIVTVIREDEIRNMGARDLIDVLRTVPGFHFGADVQGVVGLGIRGLWAAEGKHLLIVDGVEMNELQYAGTQYGNEFPIDQIKRIEIIRGPGSAIYGGFAELAVINITTKSGADLKGSQAQLTVGQWENTTARTNLSAQLGNELSGGDYSIGLYVGQAKRGDGDYAGTRTIKGDGVVYSGEIDFEDADELKPMMLNLGYNRNNFKFRFLYNKYVIDSYTMFGFTSSNGTKPNPNTFESFNLTTSYTKHLGEQSTLTPQLQVTQQRPWVQKSAEAIFNYSKSDITSTRIRPSLTYNSDVTERLNVLAGVEYVQDQHKINDYIVWDSPGVQAPFLFANGTEESDLDSTAVYVQSIYNAEKFDVTVGARYEKPSETDASFVPRVALTKAEKEWHSKFLYSQAFRSPVLFNYEYKAGTEILPETAETFEVEFGRALSSKSYLTANIFDTKIKDPIVYMASGDEEYDNFDEAGTQGLELDYRFQTRWGQVQAAYAFYQATSSKIPDYEVTGDKDRYLGMPQHMATIGTTYITGDNGWKINPQIQYQGEKSAYDFDGAAMVITDLDPVTLVNVYVSKENVGIKGLGAGVGLFNLLNEEQYYAQPYNGGHSPVPGPSTELMVRLDYNKAF